MSRETPTVVQSWTGQVANKPIELYQIFLDTETLRYAAYDVDVQFGGQTYRALGVAREAIRTTTELEVDAVTLHLDNVNLNMADQIILTDFVARRALIFVVQKGDVSSGQAMIRFDGRMDAPELDEGKLTIKIVSWLDGMGTTVPRRLFSTVCNYQLYDEWCTMSRYIDVNIGTGMAIGSSTYYTLVADYLGGKPDKYWGPIGTLYMNTGSNARLGREIIDHSQSSLSLEVRIPFPFSINSGDIFTVERACNKTVADCCSKYDNWLNYGGFPTIPRAGLQVDMPVMGMTQTGGKK